MREDTFWGLFDTQQDITQTDVIYRSKHFRN